MSIQEALARASAKPTGKRPRFLESWENERLLCITMALASELSVTRLRLDTLERLLASKGLVLPSEVEDFAPSKVEAAERALWQQEFLARILRVVQQEEEALTDHDGSSEDIAEELAR
ncbi:hypothetical protein UCD39_05850 [Nitrospirillum sp. BR 11752]|uniref:Uncharacterized protein n=1 Tax=Nitrospirillum amazonense TaxID=28077 RepID=A0A560HHG1_9PROT|nr:hypothetical protein [Nitrospirillum amazonense]MEE3623512.1 hypothetical protein [Nitrospirillum sp. BR 11752]TWB45893.1 hypothetical protein FBZ90_101228 [Nitrospirillum amazonense]